MNSLVNASDNDILMDKETEKYYNMLHAFLFDSVYRNPKAKSEETKVQGIIEGLYTHFCQKPEKMGEEYIRIMENEGKERAVADYIAGMTDHYAITLFKEIYIPKSWEI